MLGSPGKARSKRIEWKVVLQEAQKSHRNAVGLGKGCIVTVKALTNKHPVDPRQSQ